MDITLIVKASNQQFDDQTIKCGPSWTIRRLKGHLTEVYPGKPSSDEQKLIYSGQLLSDSVVLKDILRHYDGQETHTVHLVFTPKNNRHRDFNSSGSSVSAASSSTGANMSPKTNNETGATSTTTSGSRVEPTRSPESETISSQYATDDLRQRNVASNQNINTLPTAMNTSPISPASADYIMGQHLAMQNWMQQAYMQYLNQYMNVISNGQNTQALYASAPTNPANPILPQASPQTNVPQAAQPSQNPLLAQTLPNLAYYPYLSTMSSTPMPSASSIPAPITSSGTIPSSPSPAASVTPGPSSQPSISSPVPPPTTPAVGASTSSSPSSSPATTATAAATGAVANVPQDATAAAQAAPAAVPAAGGAAGAAAAPARRFPNIVVEEQENRDWLDIFFSMCRVGILITVVYLYSSPTRCLTVFLIGIGLYLYQIGFFRNNRADRMERARRMVVQQINMAHMMRQNAELRARAAPAPADPEGAANGQAPPTAATAASSTSAATIQSDSTDGPKKTDDSASPEPEDDLPAQRDETTAATEPNAEEMLINPSPEENRVNINDVAAFIRTLVLSFFTSIIPDTPAA